MSYFSFAILQSLNVYHSIASMWVSTSWIVDNIKHNWRILQAKIIARIKLKVNCPKKNSFFGHFSNLLTESWLEQPVRICRIFTFFFILYLKSQHSDYEWLNEAKEIIYMLHHINLVVILLTQWTHRPLKMLEITINFTPKEKKQFNDPSQFKWIQTHCYVGMRESAIYLLRLIEMLSKKYW